MAGGGVLAAAGSGSELHDDLFIEGSGFFDLRCSGDEPVGCTEVCDA
jgi:hypothetical protein